MCSLLLDVLELFPWLNNKLEEANQEKKNRNRSQIGFCLASLEGKWMDDGFANVLTSVILMFSDKHHMNDSTPLILESAEMNRLSELQFD